MFHLAFAVTRGSIIPAMSHHVARVRLLLYYMIGCAIAGESFLLNAPRPHSTLLPRTGFDECCFHSQGTCCNIVSVRMTTADFSKQQQQQPQAPLGLISVEGDSSATGGDTKVLYGASKWWSGVTEDGTFLVIRPPSTQDLTSLGMGSWIGRKGLALSLVAIQRDGADGDELSTRDSPLAGAVVEVLEGIGGSSVATRVCLLHHSKMAGVAEGVVHALLHETIAQFLNGGSRINQAMSFDHAPCDTAGVDLRWTFGASTVFLGFKSYMLLSVLHHPPISTPSLFGTRGGDQVSCKFDADWVLASDVAAQNTLIHQSKQQRLKPEKTGLCAGSMAQPVQFDLPEPEVGAFVGGDTSAIYVRCIQIAEEHPTSLRPFRETAARQVAGHSCPHGEQPPIVLEGNTRASRLASLQLGHDGLCGVHQAQVVSAVDAHAIFARHSELRTKKNRNQACFDAVRALKFLGHGVQAERRESFQEACRAIYPGDQELHESIRDALC